jgi:hypothetical protein
MRIAGTAYFKVDGEQFSLGGSMSYGVNKFTRESKAGLSGVVGYTETPHIPFVEGEFFMTSEIPTAKVESITNATITAELNNGKTILLRNAWTTGDVEVDAAAGTATIRFEGLEGEEI